MASAKALVYGDGLAYFHIKLKIIYAVAEYKVTSSTVNRKLLCGVYMTPIRSKWVLKWHTEQLSQTYIFGRDIRH